MPGAHTSESSIAGNINDLYWNSDRTVDEIVEELGIGRSTLYSSVRPQPAGASCPDCGERLVFTNRSNRSASTASCQACGADAALPEPAEGSWSDEAHEEEFVGSSRPRTDEAEDIGSHVHDSHGHESHVPNGGWSRWRSDLAAVAPERAAMIGGAAALGVVLGAVAARAVREMR